MLKTLNGDLFWMKTALLLILLILLIPGPAQGKPIRLEDFDWGMTLLEVEIRAAGKNYTLARKDISGLKPHLEYKTHLYGKECSVLFFFTPTGQKLYSATVTWESPDYGSSIKRMIIKEYQSPREGMSAANMYIWTRTNTEMELRYGFEDTTLTYSNLDLWEEFKEEKELIEEREEENGEWAVGSGE